MEVLSCLINPYVSTYIADPYNKLYLCKQSLFVSLFSWFVTLNELSVGCSIIIIIMVSYKTYTSPLPLFFVPIIFRISVAANSLHCHIINSISSSRAAAEEEKNGAGLLLPFVDDMTGSDYTLLLLIIIRIYGCERSWIVPFGQQNMS